MAALLVLLGIVVIGVVACIVIYNSLITLRNRYKNAYSQIDVQLKRRYDLIPNLVETAKGYIKHERETLEAVIKARNQANAANQKAAASPGEPSAMQGVIGAEYGVSGVPASFVVDSAGIIRFAEVGYTTEWGLRARLWLNRILYGNRQAGQEPTR